MASKQKREPGGRPVAKRAKPVSPVAAEIRKFQQAANACPVHKPCNPLKHCPDRDGAR